MLYRGLDTLYFINDIGISLAESTGSLYIDILKTASIRYSIC